MCEAIGDAFLNYCATEYIMKLFKVSAAQTTDSRDAVKKAHYYLSKIKSNAMLNSYIKSKVGAVIPKASDYFEIACYALSEHVHHKKAVNMLMPYFEFAVANITLVEEEADRMMAAMDNIKIGNASRTVFADYRSKLQELEGKLHFRVDIVTKSIGDSYECTIFIAFKNGVRKQYTESARDERDSVQLCAKIAVQDIVDNFKPLSSSNPTLLNDNSTSLTVSDDYGVRTINLIRHTRLDEGASASVAAPSAMLPDHMDINQLTPALRTQQAIQATTIAAPGVSRVSLNEVAGKWNTSYLRVTDTVKVHLHKVFTTEQLSACAKMQQKTLLWGYDPAIKTLSASVLGFPVTLLLDKFHCENKQRKADVVTALKQHILGLLIAEGMLD